MEFTMEARGFEDVRTRLLRFERIEVNMKPVMRRVAVRIEGEIERQFASEGSHAGTKWQPLAASTIDRKRRLGFPDDILLATGALKRSFREGGEGNIFQATRLMARVGSRLPHAKFHQHGTSKMPARPPALVSKAFRRENVKRIQRWIVTGELT